MPRNAPVVILLALLIVGALTAFPQEVQASKPPQADVPAPLIVIDKSYVVGHSRLTCECPLDKSTGSPMGGCVILDSTLPTKEQATCEQERMKQYNVFESELRTQITAISGCSGITTVSSFDDVTSTAKSTRSYWFLAEDIDGKPEQLWYLTPPKGYDVPLMHVKGTAPSDIAGQVCAIIKGKAGAAVAQRRLIDFLINLAWVLFAPLRAMLAGGWWHVIPVIIIFAVALRTSCSLRPLWRWILRLALPILWLVYGTFCIGAYEIYL